MNIFRLLVPALLVLHMVTATHGQESNNNAILERSPRIGNLKPDHKTFKQAQRQWKDGNYVEAEKLYITAYNNGGAIEHLIALAKNKIEIGDTKGANILYDFITTENPYPPYFYEQIDFNFKIGSPEIGIRTTLKFVEAMDRVGEANRAEFTSAYSSAAEAAFALEDRESLVQLHDKATKLKNGEYGEFVSFIYLCILDGEFDKALARIANIEKNGGGFLLSKLIARNTLSVVYTYKGENEKALEHLIKVKNNVLVQNRALQYLEALIAFNQKHYEEAIHLLTESLKGYYWLYYKVEPVGKYRHYTKRAEAHLAMGNLVMAKKDFESALLYHANYKPALNGLALLEGKMISERYTDKTPPEIIIIEPSTNRGLKLVSSKESVMIRGTATDASGLKSVTINGQPVYSKETGDFWGNIELASGENHVVITATDFADNVAIKKVQIERSSGITKETINAGEADKGKAGKNFAFIIASQNYNDPAIPSLEKPIPDGVRLKLILKNNYNFNEENMVTLFNPTRAEFRQKFQSVNEQLHPEDNIIIFYAGHGIWVDTEKKGYWLLTDAQRDDLNSWMSNKEVLDMIADLPARNTLLITDACFSGSVFKTRGLGEDASAPFVAMDNKISRVAITSGNDTEVPDESIFMKHLIKALSQNKEKYLTAQKMFVNQIIEAVMAESDTEPRYGTLESAGHVGGDYIFTRN